MKRLLILGMLTTSLTALAKTQLVEVTGYCNEGKGGCKICNGKWAGLNKTASGKPPKPGVTIAASRKIPFNTIVNIPGVGKRVVQDRLSKKFDNRIDVFFGSHKEALNFGKKKLLVSY